MHFLFTSHQSLFISTLLILTTTLLLLTFPLSTFVYLIPLPIPIPTSSSTSSSANVNKDSPNNIPIKLRIGLLRCFSSICSVGGESGKYGWVEVVDDIDGSGGGADGDDDDDDDKRSSSSKSASLKKYIPPAVVKLINENTKKNTKDIPSTTVTEISKNRQTAPLYHISILLTALLLTALATSVSTLIVSRKKIYLSSRLSSLSLLSTILTFSTALGYPVLTYAYLNVGEGGGCFTFTVYISIVLSLLSVCLSYKVYHKETDASEYTNVFSTTSNSSASSINGNGSKHGHGHGQGYSSLKNLSGYNDSSVNGGLVFNTSRFYNTPVKSIGRGSILETIIGSSINSINVKNDGGMMDDGNLKYFDNDDNNNGDNDNTGNEGEGEGGGIGDGFGYNYIIGGYGSTSTHNNNNVLTSPTLSNSYSNRSDTSYHNTSPLPGFFGSPLTPVTSPTLTLLSSPNTGTNNDGYDENENDSRSGVTTTTTSKNIEKIQSNRRDSFKNSKEGSYQSFSKRN